MCMPWRTFANVLTEPLTYMMGGKVRCEKSVTTDVLGISTAGSSPVVSTV